MQYLIEFVSVALRQTTLWRHRKCGYTQFEAATIDHSLAPVTTCTICWPGIQMLDPEVNGEGSCQRCDNERDSNPRLAGEKRKSHRWKTVASQSINQF